MVLNMLNVKVNFSDVKNINKVDIYSQFCSNGHLV